MTAFYIILIIFGVLFLAFLFSIFYAVNKFRDIDDTIEKEMRNLFDDQETFI